MSMRPAISAPLPWLALLAGRLLKKGGAGGGRRRPVFKLPRSLSITREGKWYIGVLLLIGVAAINTGNNLLYLVVATLLSLIIISGIMSETTLRGLRVERALPPYAFKGTPARAVLRVTNSKRFFPSYSFKLAETGGHVMDAYVLKSAPGESREVAVEYTFPRRGPARLTGLRVSTRFPFGLFIKGKLDESVGETLVLPSVDRHAPAEINGARRPSGERPSSARGSSGALHGLREYTPADDARHIHWKSAARSERLLLKEYEDETQKKVVVVFDNHGRPDDEFERAVDEAAATAYHYVELGYAVGLKTLSTQIAPVSGGEHLLRLLTELALLSPEPGPTGPSVRAEAL